MHVCATAILRRLVLAVAVAYIAVFLIAAVARLSYPYPLQVSEAPALRQALRSLHGQPLYVAPTLEHVPFVYGPVYFYLSALFASVTGPGFIALRIVSLLASVGSMVILYRLVRWETGNPQAGLVAAGLFAATYPLADTALDLGRVDALFVCLVLAAVYVARITSPQQRMSPRGQAISGGLIGLAGLTKVPLGVVPVGVAILVYLLLTHRAGALAFVIGCAVSLGSILLVLRAQSGPWPTFYVWDLPSAHELRLAALGKFWFTDFLPRFTLPLLIGPAFVLGRILQRDRPAVVFYALSISSLVGIAWSSRTSSGGAPNVLLPAHAAAAILLGLGFFEGMRQLGGEARRPRAFYAYFLCLCLAQFGLLAYNARLTVPYRSDQWADERLATTLAALAGPIFAPDLDGYLLASDKGEQPHMGAADDIMGGYGGGGTPAGGQWAASVRDALGQRRFQYVVLVEPVCCFLVEALEQAGYRDAGPLFPPGDPFYEWKTWRTPEERVYVAPGA